MNNNDNITWLDYLKAVAEQAKDLGYNMNQVALFKSDIYECWLDGQSIGDCVKTEF